MQICLGPGLLRNTPPPAGSIPSPVRQHLQRLHKGIIFIFHHKGDDISSCSASKAVIHLLRRRHGKRRGFLIMKWAQTKIVCPLFLQISHIRETISTMSFLVRTSSIDVFRIIHPYPPTFHVPSMPSAQIILQNGRWHSRRSSRQCSRRPPAPSFSFPDSYIRQVLLRQLVRMLHIIFIKRLRSAAGLFPPPPLPPDSCIHVFKHPAWRRPCMAYPTSWDMTISGLVQTVA